MGLYEYDEELHIRLEREDAYEEGRLKEWQISIVNLIEVCQELGASEEDILQGLQKKYSLSEGEAREYVAQYWKE